MVVTIDVREALIYLLFIASIILVCYLIVIARHLIKTVKQTNKILEDTAVISAIAAEKAVQVDGVITDVQSAVSDVTQAVKGQQNFIGAVTNFIKAVGSLFAIFHRDDDQDGSAGKSSKK
ncbi:MAG: hypothetical protein ACLRWH_08635 [Emergencia sp.]